MSRKEVKSYTQSSRTKCLTFRWSFMHKSLRNMFLLSCHLTATGAELSTDLDSFSRLQRLFRRNPHLPLPQQLLDEVCDVPAGDGDVLDAATDDVALSLECKEK